MQLKDVLGEIEADGAHRVHGCLLAWPAAPSLWHTRSGRWRMRLARSRAGTPSRIRPSGIRNAGPPALRTPVWPLPTRLCRLLTRSRVWGATIPARAAAARSSRSAAWAESLSGRRYRAYCEESAPQTRAIRRSSDPFSLATLTLQSSHARPRPGEGPGRPRMNRRTGLCAYTRGFAGLEAPPFFVRGA